MTQEEMRIKIAEACGWTTKAFTGFSGEDDEWFTEDRVYKPNGDWATIGKYPDYPNDLNAMHEAEKTLTEKEQVWYLQKLTQVRLKQGSGGIIACIIDKTTFATAAQRAEAFLRVKGLWKETN
jgi:hypothetical protein